MHKIIVTTVNYEIQKDRGFEFFKFYDIHNRNAKRSSITVPRFGQSDCPVVLYKLRKIQKTSKYFRVSL